MTGLDAEMARYVRREFGRRPLESTRLEIQVVQGRIYLSGTLAPLRSQPAVHIEDEIAIVEKVISQHRDFRALFNNCRVVLHRGELDPSKAHRVGQRHK